MKTLIIVPAYNEQENIGSVVASLREHCPAADVLAVNDCSTDNTRDKLRELAVCFLDLPVNLGIGGAVQAGYRYAVENGYDCAVQFDGDGQHRAEYLPALLSPLEKGDADIAVGSRFLSGEGFQSSALRRCGIRFLSWLIYRLSGLRVLDVTSGMRAVRGQMLAFYAENYAQDFPEPEALLTAGLLGARVREVAVEMSPREHGKSSIGAWSSVYYMIKVSLALLLARITFGKGVGDAE